MEVLQEIFLVLHCTMLSRSPATADWQYIEDICNSELREKVNRVCPFVELFYLYEYKIHEKTVHMSFYNLYNIFLTVKVSNADTVDDLKKALEDSTIQEILEAQGALSTVLCISDKDRMCKLLVQHIVIDSVEYLVNEVKEGLKTLGVLEAIQQHPEKFREVFCKNTVQNWMHIWLTSCFLQISTRRDRTSAHYKRRLLFIGGITYKTA